MADEVVIDPIDPVAVDPAPQADPAPAQAVDPAPAADPAPVDPAPPADWRARMAGDDEKGLAYLGKFASEKAFLADAKKKNDLLLQRAKPSKLPDNPTADELAAYRKDNDVPETMDGYLEGLPNGIVVGEEDRPNVDKFLEKMHGVHADKKTVAASLDAYYSLVAEQQADQAEADRSHDAECVDALRDEWGADYRRNSNVLKSYLDGMPEGVKQALSFGRGPDGRVLSMNPDMIRWLTSKALEENPLATVVPGAGSNQIDAIAEELSGLKTMMGNRGSEYWKGPNATKNQERYRVLVDAQAKAQKQG